MSVSGEGYPLGVGGATLLLGANVRKAKLHREPVTIYVVDEITHYTSLAFSLELAEAVAAGQAIVPVEINSPGGDVYALLSMIDAIRACPVPVATIVRGIAASAAACLFMCGHRDHRYMAPNARLMVHSVSTTLLGTLKTADMAANAAESRSVNDILCGIMADQCGQDKSFFSSMIRDKDNADVYIDTAKALELGIASSDRLPGLVARVEVSFSFETLDGHAIDLAPPVCNGGGSSGRSARPCSRRTAGPAPKRTSSGTDLVGEPRFKKAAQVAEPTHRSDRAGGGGNGGRCRRRSQVAPAAKRHWRNKRPPPLSRPADDGAAAPPTRANSPNGAAYERCEREGALQTEGPAGRGTDDRVVFVCSHPYHSDDDRKEHSDPEECHFRRASQHL